MEHNKSKMQLIIHNFGKPKLMPHQHQEVDNVQFVINGYILDGPLGGNEKD